MAVLLSTSLPWSPLTLKKPVSSWRDWTTLKVLLPESRSSGHFLATLAPNSLFLLKFHVYGHKLSGRGSYSIWKDDEQRQTLQQGWGHARQFLGNNPLTSMTSPSLQYIKDPRLGGVPCSTLHFPSAPSAECNCLFYACVLYLIVSSLGVALHTAHSPGAWHGWWNLVGI